MRFVRLSVLAAAVVFATAVPARAASITVHNTGLNATGTGLVALGAQAFFWTLVSAPAGATEVVGSNTFRFHHPAYFADTASAAWVSPAASGNASVLGNYSYRMTFDLTGFDPTSALLQGFYGTDNTGSISLNGVLIASTGFAGFGAQTAFTMNTGFLAGLNTIDVVALNGGNPTAFFVQFNTATVNPAVSAVPEPASLLLLGSGLAVLARARRRR